MHPFFSPLTPYELALLLTTLTVGGADQVQIFQALPAESRQRVQDKANALLQIAGDKRVQLMVRELKIALAYNGLRGIERMDPSWIVQGLKGESPRVVATLLVSLPAPVVKSVLRRLPAAVRQELPPKQEIKHVPEDIARAVRQMFEARFHPMPAPTSGPFVFRDLIHLERAELFHLIRDLGLIELGRAFVTVGKMVLLELCRRLPRPHAEELIHAVKVASHVDLPDPKSAQRFLSRVVMNFENTEEFLQKSGLWRLAKACLLEDAEFRLALGQRLPRRAAQHLHGYMDKAGEMEDLTPDGLQRLQDSILVRIVLLSRQGALSVPLAETPMAYHDSAAAERALEEAAALPAPSPMDAPEDVFDVGPERPPHDD